MSADAETARYLVNSRTSEVRAFDCSVVISLFNKGPYIERALKSILDQTYPVREIVVVDGGSTDGGIAKVAAMAEHFPVIKLTCQIDNGVSEGRNRGIALAKGEWVAFLDGDDAYLPWYMEEMAQLAALAPQPILLGGRCTELPPEFNLAAVAAQHAKGQGESGIVPQFYDRWWHGNLFYTSSSCARRDVLQTFAEPFPVGEHLGEDLEMFFRLAERGAVAVTSRISAVYAEGVPAGLTERGKELYMIPSFQRLRDRVETAGFPAAERAGARRCLATKWLTIARARVRSGDAAGALQLMREPVTRHRPLYWLRTAGLVAANAAKQVLSGRSPSASLR